MRSGTCCGLSEAVTETQTERKRVKKNGSEMERCRSRLKEKEGDREREEEREKKREIIMERDKVRPDPTSSRDVHMSIDRRGHAEKRHAEKSDVR